MNLSAHQIRVTVEGETFLVKVEDLSQDPVVAYVDGSRFEVALDARGTVSDPEEKSPEPERKVQSFPAGTSCEITAPMPGDIVEILADVGQAVQSGDPLCVLDAMKMKNTIHAPQEGRVSEILVREGQSVEYGTALFRLE